VTYWHLTPLDEIYTQIGSKQSGLDSSLVLSQKKKFGPNTFPSSPTHSLFTLFISQFFSPLILILVAAAIVIAFLGERADSLIIGIILTFNALIGTYQEGKAEATLDSLKHFSKTNASVLRDGREQIISDEDVVVGDVIIVREGEKVPTDARIIEVNACYVDESSLTGESNPVRKDSSTEDLTESTPVSDQHTMLFRGTYLTRGSVTAIVVSTGTETVIGKIATVVSSIDTDVPLKGKIQHLSNRIMYAVGGFSIFFLILSLLRGNSFSESLYTVITLCVSLIPEGLPVILTLVLARSVYRMSKRNALVKKLAAVEALGQASVIAVDKTGTITLNELRVEQVYTADDILYTVTGSGYDTKGQIRSDDKPVQPDAKSLLFLLTQIAMIGTQSKISYNKEEDRSYVIGDPTEAALLVFGKKYPQVDESMTLVQSDPFDYKRKYSTHLLSWKKTYLRADIGAPEAILSRCILPARQQEQIQQQITALSSQGLRVVAIAAHQSAHRIELHTKGDLEFLGLVAMRDSIHPEAKEAIQVAKAAGIQICMITGDHEATAISIAKEVGIYTTGDIVVTGVEIEKLSAQELSQRLATKNATGAPAITVFARVTPEHKLKIIAAFRANKETVAMTGDGVNDAASLVAADLGIAMGKRGTEVAKEAADIVLLDDNFKSITAAIREGRGLYLTIKNVILYLLSTGVGEAVTIAGALMLGFATPILPVQILWLNFVTDGFLDIALSFEPREKGLLLHKREFFNSHLIDKTMFIRMLLVGTTMAIGSLFVYSQFMDGDRTKALTVALTTMAAFQWFNVWNCRSNTKSLTQLNFFGNIPLIGATVVIILLHIIAVHTSFMNQFLHTTPLSLLEWVMCIGIASTIIVVEEIRKMFQRV
jgi:P-type Ca2+ transporter type 2C